MVQHEKDIPEVYLQPGESKLSTEPVLLRTVLGSCVGVVFWAPEWGVGALCHPMLPQIPPRAQDDGDMRRRYVDFAIHEMAHEIDKLGVPREAVQVKLFGGADVLQVPIDNRHPTVGMMNQEVADKVLAAEGFRVVASSLGGTRGIHIMFHTGTGEVLLRRLN